MNDMTHHFTSTDVYILKHGKWMKDILISKNTMKVKQDVPMLMLSSKADRRPWTVLRIHARTEQKNTRFFFFHRRELTMRISILCIYRTALSQQH